MKATIQKKRLIGAMSEFLICQNEFVCLLSRITGKQKENEQNCFTTNVQKITQLNSIKLNNILKEGIQKDLFVKIFSFEKDYISYLSQIKDKNICLNFIKYKSFSLEIPRNDLDA